MKEITLPEVEEFFSTGYDLEEGLGYNSSQMLEGIQSLAPMYFEKKGERHFTEFIANDRGKRKYLGLRLVDFFKDPDLEIEVFLNQPRSFFKKYYSLELDGLYTWSDRVRFCENTDNLKELLGIDSPYFMLFKKSSDEVLSQPIEKKRYLQYCAIRNTSFSLSDLALDLDERNFYVQNHILVQTK